MRGAVALVSFAVGRSTFGTWGGWDQHVIPLLGSRPSVRVLHVLLLRGFLLLLAAWGRVLAMSLLAGIRPGMAGSTDIPMFFWMGWGVSLFSFVKPGQWHCV